MLETHEAMIVNHPLARQYGDELLILDRGEGCRLVDRAGVRYLDMGSGIAVNALGCGREDLADIAREQMLKLTHASNLFATEPQLELAWKMLGSGIPGPPGAAGYAVHFGNSGAEANETAMKYARLYARRRKGEGCGGILAFTHSFHGRTMGALSITAKESYREPFEPLIPGCDFLPFNDPEALEAAANEGIAGIFVEPVQGEGGLSVVSSDFAGMLNTVCRRHDILLVSDEVQSGLGRCGRLFASELTGLEPDMITMAKPMAGGLPLSAVLIHGGINALLEVGHHATTFGGGPVTTAVASRVWDILSDPDFLAEVRRKGELAAELASGYLEGIGVPGELRGAGLLRGVRLLDERYDGMWCSKVIAECLRRGMIILKTGADVLRLAPPLVISDGEIEEGLSLLFDVIRENL